MFAIIAPTIITASIFYVEGSNIFVELAKSFSVYLDAAQKTLGIESKAKVLYLFTFSFFISLFSVVSGIFLFFKKSWARKMLLSLIILEILSKFIMMLLRGRFTIKFMAIDLLIIYMSLLIFFTRQQVVQLFTKDA